MKLLILTQKVDINDPILGFFHRWIEEFAKHFENITVICLSKGDYDLPENVKVLSLGKELRFSRINYLFNFYKYLWQERANYDTVFVHMNQEYILLGGLFWRFLGKKVTMWRNHHSGNWLTKLAVLLCNKVFCTSKFSYTAKFKKTILMPVGIDTEIFKPNSEIICQPRSILFLARISPVKKPDILIKALGLLAQKGVEFRADFYGDALPADQNFLQKIKAQVIGMGLGQKILFYPGVPNYQAPEIYNQHYIFVNLSSSGMYDKTIFEAMACGLVSLSCNRNLKDLVPLELLFDEDNVNQLVDRLTFWLNNQDAGKKVGPELRSLVLANHSLKLLAEKLISILNK